jgi:cytoskeletal protein CcmA (bactofilin family)
LAKLSNNKLIGGELSTIVGPDAAITGDLTVQHSLRIDGQVKGNLNSGETVTVGSTGVVEGDITARDVIVGGRVQGRISVSGKTILEGTSTLNGDLKTVRLVVEEGAVFNGISDMSARGEGQLHPPKKIQLFEEQQPPQ